MAKSNIEWTDSTWNPITGCSKVSQGCKFCYAETMHKRLTGMGQAKYREPFKKVRCHPDALLHPFTLKKPQKVFVNSMSDLFHPDVPFDFIDEVFAVMLLNPHITFQILTKRPEIMLQYLGVQDLTHGPEVYPDSFIDRIESKAVNIIGKLGLDRLPAMWALQPIPNVWLGTSIEDQKTANERVPILLKVPAAVHFLSCEPLLGPIDLTNYKYQNQHGDWFFHNLLTGEIELQAFGKYNWNSRVDWVIVGGESGHKARPMHPEWVRSVRDQCKVAGVPFFFKQWGTWLPFEECAQQPFMMSSATGIWHDAHGMNFLDPATGEPGKFAGGQWMDAMDAMYPGCMEFDVRTGYTDAQYLKIGKHRAGRRLDDVEHTAFPSLRNVAPELGTMY
jgi:protein gp37